MSMEFTSSNIYIMRLSEERKFNFFGPFSLLFVHIEASSSLIESEQSSTSKAVCFATINMPQVSHQYNVSDFETFSPF